MLIVSYGAGTNSTAMLIGLKERGMAGQVKAITFADTGGERPSTYQLLDYMQSWCSDNGFPEITIVKKVDKNGDVLTLEDNCLQKNMLPSIAYGFKSCSLKYKVAPQDKHFNNWPPTKAIFKAGGKVTKLIGYDADESHRAKIPSDNKYIYSYPLLDWDWGRDECVEAIKREGIPIGAGHKSACFFCPSSKPSEIRLLAATEPELMDRAMAMESNAELTTVKGLGRSYAWRDVIATDDMFLDSFIEEACGCYDG